MKPGDEDISEDNVSNSPVDSCIYLLIMRLAFTLSLDTKSINQTKEDGSALVFPSREEASWLAEGGELME